MRRYRSSTASTPGIALIAPFSAGVTVNRLPSPMRASRPFSSGRTRCTGERPRLVSRAATEFEHRWAGEIDGEAGGEPGADLLERLDALQPELHILAVDVGLDAEQ